MDRDQAHALAACIRATLEHDSGADWRGRVAVYREPQDRFVVVVYTRPHTWVLHRACHWARRN